jgi:DNA modification methylase
MGLIRADARFLPLVDGCVQTCVTSPPYFGLRDYGSGNQIGLDPSPDAYVQSLLTVFAEVWRVLKDDGTVWLNLGDSYSGGGGFSSDAPSNRAGSKQTTQGSRLYKGRQATEGLKQKDLLGIPWRVAFALQAAGWYLRSDIIWSKPNPMPESVQGSHYSRHLVTIDEYERLSGLRYRCECAGDDWAGDMPSVQAREIPHRKAPLSAEHQGQGHGTETRRTCRCASHASGVLRVSSRKSEPGEISPDAKGQGGTAEAISQLSIASAAGRGHLNGAGLADDSRAAQAQMLLLSQAEAAIDGGPCHPIEQGRTELTGEHRAGVSVVQLREEGQDDSALLVGCPGCAKCIDHHGYTFHLSAGRPTKAHEYIFLLSKQERYYYNASAIEEAVACDEQTQRSKNSTRNEQRGKGDQDGIYHARGAAAPFSNWKATRNKRSVWHVATQPYSGSHFATFPEALIEPCILAGSRPGDLVLDPFIGSGTVGAVCERFGRRWAGTDLSYQHLAKKRTKQRGLKFSA